MRFFVLFCFFGVLDCYSLIARNKSEIVQNNKSKIEEAMSFKDSRGQNISITNNKCLASWIVSLRKPNVWTKIKTSNQNLIEHVVCGTTANRDGEDKATQGGHVIFERDNIDLNNDAVFILESLDGDTNISEFCNNNYDDLCEFFAGCIGNIVSKYIDPSCEVNGDLCKLKIMLQKVSNCQKVTKIANRAVRNTCNRIIGFVISIEIVKDGDVVRSKKGEPINYNGKIISVMPILK